MDRLSFVVGSSLVLLLLSRAIAVAANEQTKTIPLEKIWGYELPGTRNIRELDSAARDPKTFTKSTTYKLAKLLSINVPDEGQQADPAFVVAATGKDALKKAYAVLTDKKKEREPLPRDSELTLVFYSYVTGWHAKINSVEQSPGLITVKYQFVAPQEPSFGAVRYALIPIGKLSKGTTRVSIEQIPPVDYRGRAVPAMKDAERFVCNSFSFDVR